MYTAEDIGAQSNTIIFTLVHVHVLPFTCVPNIMVHKS